MSTSLHEVQGSDRGLGVYIHWPFCAQKCPYCDFNSHIRFGRWDETRFLMAYQRELDFVAQHIGPRLVTSIFFGGGTPSLMKPSTVAEILNHIAKRWQIARDAEITLEANPGSVEAARFKGYRAAGVNRVSIGVQSLDDIELRKLGRIHTVEDAKAALKIAAQTFERYSFDLIYARPGQAPQAWSAELHEALAYSSDHVSLYQLTIEPDTPYAALHAAGRLVIPDPEQSRRLYEITQEITAHYGMPAYEISNHAKRGRESRHNLTYWHYGEYAGIGPGAHGRLLSANSSMEGRVSRRRTATVAEKNPERWCELVEALGHGFVEQSGLSAAEEADEMLLMGLRLREGLDLQRLVDLGFAPDPQALAGLMRLGLVEEIVVDADSAGEAVGDDWRGDELNPITLCAGPGLRSELCAKTPAANADLKGQKRLRATPQGRFVLNAVVSELSKSIRESPRRPPAVDNSVDPQ